MHPHQHALTNPQKPAIIMAGSGEIVTYADLDRRSNQGAQLFRSLGLNIGDGIALYMENHPRYLEIAWAAQRAGLYYTCISSSLTAPEIEYILRDCAAKVLIVSPSRRVEADKLASSIADIKTFSVDEAYGVYAHFDAARAAMPATPVTDQTAGLDMLYSSGTTGRPKGVKVALSGEPIDAPTTLAGLAQALFGFSKDSIYLSPAPLYHAAPLRWCMTVQRVGGTVIVMEKFDPEQALALIQKYKVTDSQWVPTHFVRMLKLSDDVRQRYDVSSLKCAIHAAAPCPVPVKEKMIAWWGEVLQEYYAGTEGNGMCIITSAEWLKKKGSVGQARLGELRICDETGTVQPSGVDGAVYFANGPVFAYHNDTEKTAGAFNAQGWSTLGDVGHVDEDGYLFLTDRKAFMIISGGVNIYPQEIENLLITHPKVADAAVVGAPDDEMGERVVAVIQPMAWSDANDAFRDELNEFVRANISRIKAPKQIDFMQELPRQATGKLYKRLIRDAYWGKQSRIV